MQPASQPSRRKQTTDESRRQTNDTGTPASLRPPSRHAPGKKIRTKSAQCTSDGAGRPTVNTHPWPAKTKSAQRMSDGAGRCGCGGIRCRHACAASAGLAQSV